MAATTSQLTGARWTPEVRRIVASSFLGSAIEFYDFILYATAASLIFGPVFFAGQSHAIAQIASFGTFAVGYIARPLGGIVFGHFGDRVGRKKVLVITMIMMGLGTTLIGVVPAVATWGALCLVLLRLIQGLAVGGEWGGSALMAMEHVPGYGRGVKASFANAGAPFGAAFGATILAVLFQVMPHSDFMSWGWRIPFLISVLFALSGLWVRARISESPLFKEAQARLAELAANRKAAAAPVVEVLRRPGTLVTVAFALAGSFVIQAIFSTIPLGDSVAHGISQNEALYSFAFCQLLAAGANVGAGWLSDKYGRRPVMVTGLLGAAVLSYPCFLMIESGNWVLVAASFIIIMTVCQSLTFGPLAAFVSEQYATGSRYTGASLGYQLASLLGVGFTPTIASALQASAGGATWPINWFVAGACVLSVIVLLVFAKETRDVDITAIGTGVTVPAQATAAETAQVP